MIILNVNLLTKLVAHKNRNARIEYPVSFFFRCPYLTAVYTVAVPIVQGILTFLVILNFARATFMDPGILPRGKFLMLNCAVYNNWLSNFMRCRIITVRLDLCRIIIS